VKGSSLQSLIQLFFTDRLRKQLGVSPHTVAAYRDGFRLLLQFASERLSCAPSALRIEDLDAPFLCKFLDHLEEVRGNCTRTRNNRLAALHAFFPYVSIGEPELALHCQRVLAIPSKRHERGPVAFLSEEESAALVAAPRLDTWIGRRHRALLLLAVPTGLRNNGTLIAPAPGCRVRRGRPCSLLRKGPKDEMHAAAPGCHRCTQGMALPAGSPSR